MDVKAILKKVEDSPVPQVKKVAVAYSGGLDSTLGIEMLRRKYKAQEIVAICIDIGQGEDEDRSVYETLNLAWDLLSMLPADALIRVSEEELAKYHKGQATAAAA